MANEFQLTTWSVLLNNIDGQPIVNLSGLNGGLADGETIAIDNPEAKPTRHTAGASGDVIITTDMQSLIRTMHIRVIKGGLAYTTFTNQANAQKKAMPSGPVPTFSGIVTQITGDGKGGFKGESFPFQSATISDYPKQVVRHANADPSQTILEFEITALFPNDQLT
jgi:hypothetical protein